MTLNVCFTLSARPMSVIKAVCKSDCSSKLCVDLMDIFPYSSFCTTEDKTECANMLAKCCIRSSAWLQIKHATYQMEAFPCLWFLCSCLENT